MNSQPAWLDVLRGACEARTQAEVASDIGYSAAVVNQVLKGTYKGDVKRVQQAVEGGLMGAMVECPVIGELPRQRCAEYQRAPRSTTNPMRVQLGRACPSCKNRRSTP